MTPYCPVKEGATPEPGMDYGYAINECMSRLRDDDWGFIFDHDCHLTTRFWFRALERAVIAHPDAGLMTTMRWPAVSTWSAPSEARPRGAEQYDIRYHRKLGEQIARKYQGRVDDVTAFEALPSASPTAGIFLIPKRVWAEVGGFKSGFKAERIDHDFHIKVRATGRRCLLIRDVYFYHAKGL
jgi:hypothetical protein